MTEPATEAADLTDSVDGGDRLDLSYVPSSHSLRNRAGRLLWAIVYVLLFRPSPRLFYQFRTMLLKLFGAKMGKGAKVYPSARVWAPWNLEMGDHSAIGDYVDCYSVAKVIVGEHVVVSQYCFICAATHDEADPRFALIAKPIVIGKKVWLCADVFVGPGVTIGEGSVVGARSSVFGDLPPWKICVGTPARPRRDRVIREQRIDRH